MFKALFGRNVNSDLAHALYGVVVARSRDLQFYIRYQVPDTFDGRFEILIMHLFLLHNRLKNEDHTSRQISQLVFDAFIDDMDAALREIGVGDPSVPKKIAKMTQVFYGRTGAYERALESEDISQALSVVIRRNLYAGIESNGAELDLGQYMAWQAADLTHKTALDITQQQAVFEGPLLERTAYGR
ncbi:MAG: ubiquinol-cytochrome C chaperone [Rhizobiaceae bacterium]|nr:ubiquinol-cytochrome C chaperone [Rhizobiaceae bacterium]